MALFKIARGNSTNFAAIATKNADTLYLITDKEEMYIGDKKYGGSVEFLASLDGVTGDLNTIYMVGSGSAYTAYAYNGTTFVAISTQTSIATTISDASTNDDAAGALATYNFVTGMMSSGVSIASTNTQIATSKAVYDYVEAATTGIISGTDIESTITAESTNTKVAGAKAVYDYVATANTGVVTTPTYNSTERIITLPITGSADLVINLGKDLVVSSGTLVTVEDVTYLRLTLTSGDTVDISVDSLVNDIYSGGETATVDVTVTNGVITAAVNVSATAGNAITTELDGLYVARTTAIDKQAANYETVLATAKAAADYADLLLTIDEF